MELILPKGYYKYGDTLEKISNKLKGILGNEIKNMTMIMIYLYYTNKK